MEFIQRLLGDKFKRFGEKTSRGKNLFRSYHTSNLKSVENKLDSFLFSNFYP